MCSSSPKKTRTGVYGGSFNPVHLGHTAMAAEILRQGLLDEMWLVVSPQNPFKIDHRLWDDMLRLRLARLATEGMPGVEVSDVEFGLPKPNYMLTTLDTLAARHPERDFSLVIGMDNWECFDRWYRSDEILQRYPIIVLPRRAQEGHDTQATPREATQGEVLFFDTELVDLSSTWIREQVTNNPSYQGEGLDPRVWEMIKQKMR